MRQRCRAGWCRGRQEQPKKGNAPVENHFRESVHPACGRATPRHSMFIRSIIRRPHDAVEHPIRIRNLSAGGLMGETTHVLRRREHVVIALRGVGDMAGHVAWVHGHRFGIAFSRTINLKLVREAMASRRLSQVILTHVADHRRPGLARPEHRISPAVAPRRG